MKKGSLAITWTIFSVFASLTKTLAQETLPEITAQDCAASQSGCPYGTDSGLPDYKQLCYPIVSFFSLMYGQCYPYFGSSLSLTYAGFEVGSLARSPNDTCPDVDTSGSINDCLPQNTSLTSNLCMTWFAIAYASRMNCSEFYTMDPCQFTPLGDATVDHYTDPSDYCTPAPYYTKCQTTSLGPAFYCPGCVIGSCPSS